MAIMFVLLSVLEDSGYLARAAFVVDRLMRLIGLPGRAFLPLVVGFGCNVPALAGTRILADRRHRLLTGLLIPFVSCSARLTVYVLVARRLPPGRRRQAGLRHAARRAGTAGHQRAASLTGLGAGTGRRPRPVVQRRNTRARTATAAASPYITDEPAPRVAPPAAVPAPMPT